MEDLYAWAVENNGFQAHVQAQVNSIKQTLANITGGLQPQVELPTPAPSDSVLKSILDKDLRGNKEMLEEAFGPLP